MFKKISMLCACPLMLSLSAFAGEMIEWGTSGDFVGILAESNFQNVQLRNFQGVENYDYKQSSCVATVYRPSYTEGPIKHDANILNCNFLNNDGSKGSLQFSLKDFPIEPWGYVHGQRYFQIQDDRSTTLLFGALKKAYFRSPRIARISRMFLESPCQSFLTEVFFLNIADSRQASAHLACDQQLERIENTNEYTTYKIRCVFMDSNIP